MHSTRVKKAVESRTLVQTAWPEKQKGQGHAEKSLKNTRFHTHRLLQKRSEGTQSGLMRVRANSLAASVVAAEPEVFLITTSILGARGRQGGGMHFGEFTGSGKTHPGSGKMVERSQVRSREFQFLTD